MPEAAGDTGGGGWGQFIGDLIGGITGSGRHVSSTPGRFFSDWVKLGRSRAAQSGSQPATPNKGPAVAYDNSGYYEPYRGSPRTHNKKTRRRSAKRKLVDNRPVWEQIADWASAKFSRVDSTPKAAHPGWSEGPRSTWPKDQQEAFDAYFGTQLEYGALDAILGAASGRAGAVRRNAPVLEPPPGRVGTLTKPKPVTKQSGFVMTPKPKTTTRPVIEEPVGPGGPSSPYRTVTVPSVRPAAPGVAPSRAQPAPTAPDTRTQDYVNAELITRAAAGAINPTVKVSAGPGRTDAAPSAARKPGNAGTSAPGTGKSGPAAPVALPGVGPLVISPDALFREMLRQLSKRSPGVRTGTQLARAAFASPGRATSRAEIASPLAAFAGGYAGTRSDTCECDRKKPKKPRQPRSVCYRGTYVESARGLSKTRREQVPC